MTSVAEAPVKKSIAVKATVDHAFKVFTEGFDTWWPRSHHIGKQPMVKAVIETHAGGRCYGREADGTECDWGRVLSWEPPHRFCSPGFSCPTSAPAERPWRCSPST